MRRKWTFTVCSVATAAGAALSWGCGATCDRDVGAPIPYTEGITDLEDGVYESSPWEGPYIDFRRGLTFRLIHELGGAPRIVETYLAFEANPLPADGQVRGGEHSNTAPGAGNQVILEAVTSEYIDIRNDTCSDIFLRLVASSPAR